MPSIYPDLPCLTVSVDTNGVALVLLDRPEQRNTYNTVMKNSLVTAYGRLDADNNVKVVVLSGAPNKGRAFCAGLDLAEADFASSPTSSYNTSKHMNDHRDSGGQSSLATLNIRKPTIAAINGHAVGIGITMTLPFDIRLAWADAKIGFVFGKRGVVPEAGSSYFLPKLIGYSRALELFMTAGILPATAPVFSNLFSSTHATPEATVEAALALATEIASKNSPISMALTKAMVWRGANTPEEQTLLDSKAMHVSGNALDSQEGVQSFKEKRDPKFPAQIPRDLPTELYPWWASPDVRHKL